MFEEMTFENILSQMLENVQGDVDKREGSIIYDALAPVARKVHRCMQTWTFFCRNVLQTVHLIII